jgi:hypothetical protein
MVITDILRKTGHGNKMELRDDRNFTFALSACLHACNITTAMMTCVSVFYFFSSLSHIDTFWAETF